MYKTGKQDYKTIVHCTNVVGSTPFTGILPFSSHASRSFWKALKHITTSSPTILPWKHQLSSNYSPWLETAQKYKVLLTFYFRFCQRVDLYCLPEILKSFQHCHRAMKALVLIWSLKLIFQLQLIATFEVHAEGIKIFDIGEFGTSKRQSPRACSSTKPYNVNSVSVTCYHVFSPVETRVHRR